MRKNAFTLIEMIAVLAVLGILILIVLPVMRNVLIDFEQKSNKQIYEQLYKSSKLYYVENRNTAEKLTWNAPYVSSDDKTDAPDLEAALPDFDDMLEKTWTVNPAYFSTNLAWACISTEKMVSEGYLKQVNLTDIKSRLDINESLYVVMMGEIQNGNKRSFKLTDNALIVKDDLKWDSGNCKN